MPFLKMPFLTQASSLDWTIVRPGLLQKEATQGGILLGAADRWTGAAQTEATRWQWNWVEGAERDLKGGQFEPQCRVLERSEAERPN